MTRVLQHVLCALISWTLVLPAEAAPAQNGERRPQLLLVGLDGAEWDVINALIPQGRLPHLAALIERGAAGPLRSEKPTRSPAIWATIATGKDRSVHQIYDFMTNTNFWPTELRDGEERRLVTSNMRKSKAIWNMLEGPDLSVAIVGWLNTWPAEVVNGHMVTSYTAVGKKKQITIKGSLYRDVPNQTYPAELYDELKPFIIEVGDVTDADLLPITRLPASDDPLLAAHRSPESDLEKGSIGDLVKGLRWSFANNTTYTRAALHLIETRQPRFCAVYLDGIDSVGHRFWLFRKSTEYIEARLAASDFDPNLALLLKHYFSEVVDNYYSYIDGLVGSLVGAVGPDALVVVVSDHGFQDMEEAANRTAATFSGIHRLNGVIIMSGPGIEMGTKIRNARVADLTPTLLHLLGRPVGDDMTGQVIVGALKQAFVRENPVRSIPSYEDRDFNDAEEPIEAPGVDTAVLENLRTLGYTADSDPYTPEPAETGE